MSENDTLQSYLESCRLVTARLIESVVRNSQMASSTTPEMEELFNQWRDLMAHELLSHCNAEGLDVDRVAARIGISPSSALSLLLALHRSGEITIRNVQFERKASPNREICDCLREDS